MAEHTPGPWENRLRNTGHHHTIMSARGKAVAHTTAFGCTQQVNQYLEPNLEEEANAKLIAAAPELLLALKGLLTCSLPNDISGQRFVDRAVEAIAKAEGR